MVSIKDISAACGVSVATVSKALNNQKDVSDATKARIKEVAKQMGYVPNSASRSLKIKRTYNLGIVYDEVSGRGLTHDFFAQVLDAFKHYAENHGYDITFVNNNPHGSDKMTYLEKCRYRNFDGVMIACSEYENKQIQEVIDSEIPSVCIDYSKEGKSSVMSDNAGGMRQLVDYAVSRGYKRISYIHGEDTPVTKERKAAFLSETKKLGIDVPSEYIREGKYRDTISSEKITYELLELNETPECIMYPDDYAALGGVNALMHRGINIYNGIEVIGYDGILYKKGLPARITSVIQDTETIGETAARLLLQNIKEPGFSEKVVVEGKLIEHKNIELMMGAKLP